jgi:D-sedoheptulose 7-phosphate isomerase
MLGSAELIVRYRINRPAIPSIVLMTDSSLLTAIGNAFRFEDLFSRQGRGPGSAVGISTFGRSINILRVLEADRERGLVTVGFTGTGPGAAMMRRLCNFALASPSEETALVQQIYLVVARAICTMLEGELVADATAGWWNQQP